MDRDFGPRFSLDELVEATGVAGRTVRYYIAQGIVPRAAGSGRNAHYTADHVEAVAKARDLRNRNLSIDEIREVLQGERQPIGPPDAGEHWNRIRLNADLEIHLREGAPDHVRELVRQIMASSAVWFGEEDTHDSP